MEGGERWREWKRKSDRESGRGRVIEGEGEG